MKFGIREICNVVFKAKTTMNIGEATFKAGQPVLYIDTATAATLEQATTAVYARGGRGNTKLITWEGEKELTFTLTDALLSPVGLTILTGAGLYGGSSEEKFVHVHMSAKATADIQSTALTIDLTQALKEDETIDSKAPVFVVIADGGDGSLTGKMVEGLQVASGGKKLTKTTSASDIVKNGDTVFVDFYVKKAEAVVSEIQIDASCFNGNFYVEASTLVRRQSDGKDMACEITLPNVKIQSNISISMSATGDPSTFDFTMDAMPGYTFFDRTREVLCVMQIIDEVGTAGNGHSVMAHKDDEKAYPQDYSVTPAVDVDSVL